MTCKFVHNAHFTRFSAMESMLVIISQGLQRSILSLKPGKENFLMMIRIAPPRQKRKTSVTKIQTFLIPQNVVLSP